MPSVLANAKLDQFFRLSQDLFCCIDFEGRLLQVNPAFETLLGYSAEALVGRRCGIVVDPQDHNQIEAALARMQRGEIVPAFEVRAISVSGQVHWIEITPTAGGDIIYIIAREVTQQKLAQAQLMSNQRLFQIAGETALIGGWYVDMADGVPIWSDELSHIHGMPSGFQPSVEEAFSFYAPDSRERLLAAFSACCERGISFDDEYEIITPQGNCLWVRAIGKAVRDAEGTIIPVSYTHLTLPTICSV